MSYSFSFVSLLFSFVVVLGESLLFSFFPFLSSFFFFLSLFIFFFLAFFLFGMCRSYSPYLFRFVFPRDSSFQLKNFQACIPQKLHFSSRPKKNFCHDLSQVHLHPTMGYQEKRMIFFFLPPLPKRSLDTFSTIIAAASPLFQLIQCQ